jgi:hypothetical protein
MTPVLSSSFLTALWFILAGFGESSLAAEAPVRVVVSFSIRENPVRPLDHAEYAQGLGSLGNLSSPRQRYSGTDTRSDAATCCITTTRALAHQGGGLQRDTVYSRREEMG